ncbi:sperm-associated antigen 1 isoform X2 [Xyrauchen texanus]|uniref:sperm-associated antigen 1 isoform X1 n=1 Tax=Xyrauchen texanus TaxID=154827 RepID=UPI002241C9E0|nr:sperm-associated antigen 1 isoform X1 [Xyrauchen texanus]XP_052002362.1 sperm-associated antigen 1 isoform X2 [Xyrauchen texanus]
MSIQAVSALVAPGSSCWSVPVEHLDYSFIQNCSDLNHLEQILRVLRSGQEGFYPHLIEFCEKHMENLDPKSGVLRQEKSVSTAACFSAEEWTEISEELQMWERNMRINETELKRNCLFSDVEDVPPVRSSNTTDQRTERKYNSSPGALRDRHRFHVDKDEMHRTTHHSTTNLPIIRHTINNTALSAQEKCVLSRREKDKGNDAFRSGDYEEAAVYYSRSLSLMSSVTAYNNRAQTHIKLKRWHTALSDCNAVLQLEPGNVKALLRRSTVHKHLGHLQECQADLRTVLLMEPHNITAQKLLLEHTQTDNHQEKVSKKILIQEVEEEEEEEEEECYDEEEKGEDHNDEVLNSESQFNVLKTEGNDLVKRGCYQDALHKYTECVQLKPHECVVYTNRALCYIKLERFTEAKQDCDSALQLHPTNKKAFYRRALANKGLKDYLASHSDLQQLLCLDVSVVEAQELLIEVKHLMEVNRCSPARPRKNVPITEVDSEDDDGDEYQDSSDNRPNRSAGVPSIHLQPSNAYEFGQALNAARSHGDLLTCAELLCSVASERLPHYISTQLDAHTLSFIIQTLDTHLLHTHTQLVYEHLTHLHTAHRFSMVLMLLDREERRRLSQLFEHMSALQNETFSQNDVRNLSQKYI